MKRYTYLIFLLLFVLSLKKAFSQDMRVQIAAKARQIEALAYESNATDAEMHSSLQALNHAVEVLRGKAPTHIQKKCIEFSLPYLKRSYSSSTALEIATRKCSSVVDMRVLEFLVEKHRRSHTYASAMEKALDEAIWGTGNKIRMIEFAFEKHNRSLTDSSAASRAASNVLRVSLSGGLQCFKEYFPIFHRGLTSSSAMEKTARTCSY